MTRRPISAFIGIALILLGCSVARASGTSERSVRDVGGFDGVSFNTDGELIVIQGDREALEIVWRADELRSIVTEVRDGTLHIGREGKKPLFQLQSPVFRLTVKTITSIEANSSGNISAKNLRTGLLRIRIGSSGGISIDSLAADSLEARLHSSGSLHVTGKVNEQSILLSSSGYYSGGALECRTAKVRASSSGSATLRVSDSLEAEVTSSGNVRYYGNPGFVNGKVTSSGRLVKL
jgi:hypothetical protein